MGVEKVWHWSTKKDLVSYQVSLDQLSGNLWLSQMGCTVHSWMDDCQSAFLMEGVFCLLSLGVQLCYPFSSHTHSVHPKVIFLPDKHSWTWTDLCPVIHTPCVFTAKCSVSEVSDSGLQETEGKETWRKRIGQMATPTALKELLFLITRLTANKTN